MQDQQITEEVLRYLNDVSYHYAILIDGEWGCGKTYYIKKTLMNAIHEIEEEKTNPRRVKYISLYGCKTIKDIQENIVWELAEDVVKKCKGQPDSSNITSTIATTSRKLVNSAIKHYAPEVNAYDIIAGVSMLKACIFILDDLERCDCPMNTRGI